MEIKELTKYSPQIPLPWLVGTIAALLFNAGLVYQQFQDVKTVATQMQPLTDRVTAINSRVDLISERITGVDARISGQDQDIRDHEHRMRRIESDHAIAAQQRSGRVMPQVERPPKEHGQ